MRSAGVNTLRHVLSGALLETARNPLWDRRDAIGVCLVVDATAGRRGVSTQALRQPVVSAWQSAAVGRSHWRTVKWLGRFTSTGPIDHPAQRPPTRCSTPPAGTIVAYTRTLAGKNR